MKILIDNGHGVDTIGKCSPDKKFYEYLYNRYIAQIITNELQIKGYDAERIVYEEQDISLKERVKRINNICDKLGKNNVIVISIHCNAASNGNEWSAAQGWSAYTSKNNTKSDILAECLYKEAKKNFIGRKIRTDYSDNDADFEENFFILKNTKCIAVLTENFFMDNKDDLLYLCSDVGKNAIIQTHINGVINFLKENKI